MGHKKYMFLPLSFVFRHKRTTKFQSILYFSFLIIKEGAEMALSPAAKYAYPLFLSVSLFTLALSSSLHLSLYLETVVTVQPQIFV